MVNKLEGTHMQPWLITYKNRHTGDVGCLQVQAMSVSHAEEKFWSVYPGKFVETKLTDVRAYELVSTTDELVDMLIRLWVKYRQLAEGRYMAPGPEEHDLQTWLELEGLLDQFGNVRGESTARLPIDLRPKPEPGNFLTDAVSAVSVQDPSITVLPGIVVCSEPEADRGWVRSDDPMLAGPDKT